LHHHVTSAPSAKTIVARNHFGGYPRLNSLCAGCDPKVRTVDEDRETSPRFPRVIDHGIPDQKGILAPSQRPKAHPQRGQMWGKQGRLAVVFGKMWASFAEKISAPGDFSPPPRPHARERTLL
jgi:hypothetical protein